MDRGGGVGHRDDSKVSRDGGELVGTHVQIEANIFDLGEKIVNAELAKCNVLILKSCSWDQLARDPKNVLEPLELQTDIH